MIARFELVLTSLGMASTVHAESTFKACPASFADLLSDKVSTVLEHGEEVPTASALRHINNIGKSKAGSEPRAPDIKIVNAVYSGHVMSEAMATAKGQKGQRLS